MGTGILAFVKGWAPLALYLLGAFMFFVAMSGKVRWTLALVTFLIPLRNVIDRIQQFPLGSQYIDLLIIAMLFGWFVSSLGKRDPVLGSSSLNVPIVILIFYTFISLQIGNNYLHLNSIMDISDPRVQDWKNFCLLPFLYLITYNNVKNLKWVWIIFIATCCSMVVMDYYTSSQVSWFSFSSLDSRNKINGTFQFLGPNEVAAFYNQYSLLLMGVFFFMKRSWRKVFLGVLICVNLYCVAFLYSRAAYLAVAVGMFFMFSLKNRKLLIPLLLAVVFWQMVLPERARERFLETRNQYGEYEISAEERLDVWGQSMEIFENHSLVGIGFGVFRHLGMGLADTHNIYVKILVEQGVLGMVAFGLVILGFLREGFRLYQKGQDDLSKGLGLGLMACIVVLLANNIFGDRWTYFELSAFLWIYAGLVSRLNRISEEPVTEKKPEDKKKRPRRSSSKKSVAIPPETGLRRGNR